MWAKFLKMWAQGSLFFVSFLLLRSVAGAPWYPADLTLNLRTVARSPGVVAAVLPPAEPRRGCGVNAAGGGVGCGGDAACGPAPPRPGLRGGAHSGLHAPPGAAQSFGLQHVEDGFATDVFV